MTASLRRWFVFSLRTLFVVMTLLGCWLGYQHNWVRKRNNMRAWVIERHGSVETVKDWGTADYDAELELPGPIEIPWCRKILGDEAVVSVGLPFDASEDEIQRASLLFPEAFCSRQLPPGTGAWPASTGSSF